MNFGNQRNPFHFIYVVFATAGSSHRIYGYLEECQKVVLRYSSKAFCVGGTNANASAKGKREGRSCSEP